MTDFLDISNVNISEINYELPENNETYEYLAKLSNQSLVFSLPKMKVYSNGVYEKNGISYFDLLLGKTHKNLYDFMSELDTHNVEFVSKNSNTWYDKNIEKDIIQHFYRNSIESVKKLPILRINVDTNNLDTNLIEKNKEVEINLELVGLITKKQYLGCLLSFHSFVGEEVVVPESVETREVTEIPEETLPEIVGKTETVETNEVETPEVVEETVETVENTQDDTPEVVEETVETVENTQDDTPEVVEETVVEQVLETSEVDVENTLETTGGDVEDAVEEVLDENVIENDVKSTISRRSNASNKTSSSKKSTGSKYSLVSEQMDIVKKMQRDAMIAERYANKKKLDALKEIHKLRNLEISEMFSQYKDFNVDDGDENDFIETQSYLEISRN